MVCSTYAHHHDASAVVCDLRDVFRQREPFWLIKLEYGPARTTFHWARERLFDQEVCRILFEIVQAQEQARVIEAREQYVESTLMYGGLSNSLITRSPCCCLLCCQAHVASTPRAAGHSGAAETGVEVLPHAR